MPTLADVYAGVDTHRETHTVAVVDRVGEPHQVATFGADPDGYRAISELIESYGRPVAVGVEGTGSYGAGLARHLAVEGIEVREVIRPNRQSRRRYGKSDPADAVAAARAVISGEASGRPRGGVGPVESIRMIRNARNSAVGARTRVVNQMHAVVATAPEPLSTRLGSLSVIKLVTLPSGCVPTTSPIPPALPKQR